METDSKRTTQWGDQKYLPNYRIPYGVHDYMVFQFQLAQILKLLPMEQSYLQAMILRDLEKRLQLNMTRT